MGLVDDEFEGVAEVPDVAMEVEVVSLNLLSFCVPYVLPQEPED